MRTVFSTRQRLAMLINGVVLAVVLLSGLTAYLEMRSSAVAAATERLEHVTRQLVDMLGNTGPRLRDQVGGVARDSAVTALFRVGGERNKAAALASLRRSGLPSSQVASVELWDPNARRQASTQEGLPPVTEPEARELAALVAGSEQAAVGWIARAGDSLLYSAIARVSSRDRLLGYVVQRRRLASSAQDSKALRDVVGSDAEILIGNTRGDLWTDFTSVRPPPPLDARRASGVVEYERARAGRALAAVMPIPNTPWALAVEFPLAGILAPAQRVLWRIALYSAVLLLLATASGWWLSGSLTRPIAELATATEEISTGNYARRVTITGHDEIGTLGDAFNRMADRITRTRNDLQHKVAEAAISETRLQQAITSSGAVIYHLRQVGRTLQPVWISENMKQVLGYDAGEALDPAWWTAAVHPDDLKQLPDRTGEAAFEEGMREYRIRRKDGVWRLVRDQQHPQRDLEGLLTEAVGTLLDITDYRQLTEQLRQAQKMEAIGRLAGGVAHDFNNLLTVIRSYCDLVLLEMGEADPRRPELLEIRSAADRASDLAKQMLAFSRKRVIVPRALDLNEVIRSLYLMLGRLSSAPIELALRLTDGLGAIKADQGQLEQVLLNLAVNAADAMPTGGHLTIETANVTLDAEYARQHRGVTPGEYVLVSVNDTGTGMDSETLDHIFEPFFTTKPVGKGTGLGLATAYGIVTQSGGHIWVYSEPGHGTTFKVYFPRVDEEVSVPRARAVGTPAPEMKRPTETVLVVEDEPSVRTTLTRILQRQGYKVLPASHGGEAMRVASETLETIDLVISDLMMPEMSGRDFIKRFSAARPTTRVLFMSGYTNDEAMQRGLLDQGQTFIEKPFTVEQITRKVREVLEQAAN